MYLMQIKRLYVEWILEDSEGGRNIGTMGDKVMKKEPEARGRSNN